MRVLDLEEDPERAEHIARHHVVWEEIEDVVFGKHTTERVREGKYGLVGQTSDGRYLTVILVPRGRGVYAVITARDSTEQERRRYQR